MSSGDMTEAGSFSTKRNAERDEIMLNRCCNQVPKDWTVHPEAWRVLRGAMSQAVRDELLPRNVAALVRVPLPRSKVRSSWTVSDARRFLEFSFHSADPMHAGDALHVASRIASRRTPRPAMG